MSTRAASILALIGGAVAILWTTSRSPGGEDARLVGPAEALVDVANEPASRGQADGLEPVAAGDAGPGGRLALPTVTVHADVEVRWHRAGDGSKRHGAPVPDARVVVRTDGGRGEELAAAVTGPEGVAQFELPALEGSESRLGAVLDDPRFAWSGAPLTLGAGPGATLIARDGGSLEVRLVDGAGKPATMDVAGSRAFYDWKGRLREGATRRSASRYFPALRGGLEVRPLGEGWHAISAGPQALPGRILLEAQGYGVGTLEVDPATWDRAGEPRRTLTLVGPAHVRGQVVDSAGRPVSALPLTASWTHEGKAGRGGTWSPPQRERLDRQLEGAGLVVGTTATDADGRFEIRGLAAGPFALFAPRVLEHRPTARVTRVGTAVASPDPDPVTLLVDRPGVVVHVLDDIEEEVQIDVYDGGPMQGPARVAPMLRSGESWAPKPIAGVYTGMNTAGARHRFDLRHGRRYLIVATAGERAWTAARRWPTVSVTLPASHTTTDVELRCKDLVENPEVEVIVARAGGSVDFEPSHARTLVTLVDPRTGLTHSSDDIQWRHGQREVSVTLRAPGGLALATATNLPKSARAWGGGLIHPMGRAGHAEELLRIDPGRPAKTRLELGRGGSLELSVGGVFHPAEEPFRSERLASAFASGELDETELSTRVTLWTGAGLPVSTVTWKPETRDWLFLDDRYLRWPLGATRTSGPVPSGTYELRATHPSRDPISLPVTSREGSTTPVRLEFPR